MCTQHSAHVDNLLAFMQAMVTRSIFRIHSGMITMMCGASKQAFFQAWKDLLMETKAQIEKAARMLTVWAGANTKTCFVEWRAVIERKHEDARKAKLEQREEKRHEAIATRNLIA